MIKELQFYAEYTLCTFGQSQTKDDQSERNMAISLVMGPKCQSCYTL